MYRRDPFITGWGWLVPVLLTAGVAGAVAAADHFWGAKYSSTHPWVLGVGLALGGAVCWGFGRRVDRRDNRYLGDDTATTVWGTPIKPPGGGSPHALFFIPMHWYGALAMLVAIPVGLWGVPNRWLPKSVQVANEPAPAVAAPVVPPNWEMQQLAMRRYPALAVLGSPFNVAYCFLYRQFYRDHPEFFRNPQWPVLLAEEVARIMVRPSGK